MPMMPVREAPAPLDPTVQSGTTAAGLPAQPAGPAQTPASATTAAFNCGLIRSTRPKKGSVLSCFWVAASPDDTPVLMGCYDASRIGRDMVDLIIQTRYGVPDEVVEVEL